VILFIYLFVMVHISAYSVANQCKTYSYHLLFFTDGTTQIF